jgi:hypothetical protein
MLVGALIVAAGLLYAASGPLRGWLVQIVHGP